MYFYFFLFSYRKKNTNLHRKLSVFMKKKKYLYPKSQRFHKNRGVFFSNQGTLICPSFRMRVPGVDPLPGNGCPSGSKPSGLIILASIWLHKLAQNSIIENYS